MVEGGSSKEFRFTKQMMYAQPEVLHALLDHLADSVIDYLNAQIDAGAQAIQIFDSWGGALAHREYVEFSLNYMKRLLQVCNVKKMDAVFLSSYSLKVVVSG